MITFSGVVKIVQHAPLSSLWGLPQKNEDPAQQNIWESRENCLKKGNLNQRKSKKQYDIPLSRNFIKVFVFYKTPPKVENQDPIRIGFRSLSIT